MVNITKIHNESVECVLRCWALGWEGNEALQNSYDRVINTQRNDTGDNKKDSAAGQTWESVGMNVTTPALPAFLSLLCGNGKYPEIYWDGLLCGHLPLESTLSPLVIHLYLSPHTHTHTQTQV